MIIWFESVHDSFIWIEAEAFLASWSKLSKSQIMSWRSTTGSRRSTTGSTCSNGGLGGRLAPGSKKLPWGSSILLRVSLHRICVCQASPFRLMFWAARTATLRLTMVRMGRVEMRRTAECMDGDGGFFSVPMWLGYAWMICFFVIFWGWARLFGREELSETQHSHHGYASTRAGRILRSMALLQKKLLDRHFVAFLSLWNLRMTGNLHNRSLDPPRLAHTPYSKAAKPMTPHIWWRDFPQTNHFVPSSYHEPPKPWKIQVLSHLKTRVLSINNL